MIKRLAIKVAFFVGIFLLAFTTLPKKPIRVYLIGDSTMSIKETKAYPETGWGMPFALFFDSTVVVDNRAKNGRSTKTFITEKLWQPVASDLQEGDYVFIQFGHNDEVKTKASYSTEEEFTSNLKRFIDESRSKKGNPVLITPVARRKFDSLGHITETHHDYSNLVRSVAKQTNVPLIDLDKESQEFLQQYGPDKSKMLFNWLAQDEHPNYPRGNQDDTHFNELGARKVAEIVLKDIRAMKLELADRIIRRKSS